MWSEWLEATLERTASTEDSALRDSLRRVQFLLIHDIIDDLVDDNPATMRDEPANETVD